MESFSPIFLYFLMLLEVTLHFIFLFIILPSGPGDRYFPVIVAIPLDDLCLRHLDFPFQRPSLHDGQILLGVDGFPCELAFTHVSLDPARPLRRCGMPLSNGPRRNILETALAGQG